MVDTLTTSAISWGLSAAGWLISPVLSRFLNKFFDALGMDPPRKTLLEKLDRLQTTIRPELLILADLAQQSSHRQVLEKWIQKLKSSFYEAEHVLSLVEYKQLEKKVNSLFPPAKSNFNSLKAKLNLKGKLQICSSEKKNLIKSLENLEEIVNEGMKFVNLYNLPRNGVNNFSSRYHSETISSPGSTVVGRDQDRDYIVKLLRDDLPESSNHECYSVIGIWGMGGSGKTTLAQYVCEFERKKIEQNNDNYFDLVIWAHVSDKFSVDAILKKIWESAFEEACPNFNSLEGLQRKLQGKLKEKRFFLVLDDAWCDKGVGEKEFEQLFAPLRAGKKGSKILVTTRVEEAAKALGAIKLIQLRELDDEQFLSLFMSNAFGGTQIRDEHLKDKLMLIGKEIAIKLHRSPLAAKIMARRLCTTPDVEFWSSILKSSLLNETLGVLFLSYQHLPSPLQRCFAFCSLFPKGYLFENDELVNLWIAHGFIDTEDTNEHMKDIGNRYFKELVSSSFFQVNKNHSNGYSMHDLIHDLALYVSEGECFTIESAEQKKIPNQTRHLYVVPDMLGEYVKEICKLKELRTIIISSHLASYEPLKEEHLDALFMNLRKLYVVDLQNIQCLPKSLIRLKNLRYLCIARIEQENTILESINRLYQLRALRISNAISNVGRLILLHDLEEFHVKKRRGFELKQLAHLTNLFGSLYIYDLHNVERTEEINQVKLYEKRGLKKLQFCWNHESEDVLSDVDVDILEGLCPPPQLKELFIDGYNGARLPNWTFVEKNNNIIHLEHLELYFCRGLEDLNMINELSYLQSLTIWSLPRLKSWVSLPLNLAEFTIFYCPSLAFALKEDLDMIMSARNTKLSQIVTFSDNFKGSYFDFIYFEEMNKPGHPTNEQSLSISSNDLKGYLEKRLDLSQIKNLYDNLCLPNKLQKLSIYSHVITNSVFARSLQGLNNLTHLKLSNIWTITSITYEVLSSLTSLIVLDITACLLLMSIDGWDTHCTLEQLSIYCCPNLALEASIIANITNVLEQTLPSCKRETTSSILNSVSLISCMVLDDSFKNLVSLKTLFVKDSPKMSNPHIGYLQLLTDLSFYDCPNLVSLRGLRELNHLDVLGMYGCHKFDNYSNADKLPRLERLSIHKFCQLEKLISRDGFSSLVFLTLCDAEEECFSQHDCEVLCYLSSLETIEFYNCKMHVLPNLLYCNTLEYVRISGCKNLTSLSELPASVLSISIVNCNEEFTRSCTDPSHPNWQKISHIPEKDV